jgi:hypothetical protein
MEPTLPLGTSWTVAKDRVEILADRWAKAENGSWDENVMGGKHLVYSTTTSLRC